jgi:hypothetical protein
MSEAVARILENATRLVDWRDGLICPVCGKVATYATARSCSDAEDCPVEFFQKRVIGPDS